MANTITFFVHIYIYFIFVCNQENYIKDTVALSCRRIEIFAYKWFFIIIKYTICSLGNNTNMRYRTKLHENVKQPLDDNTTLTNNEHTKF